ncbi:Ig-like domain-containing protein [Ascidiimonas aurantiaca]|uniref:Ig-like domain-containing protein n=1 Tax=Ascidiimonas aurantiaca TaxID=1685432 RepID=UPI0030EF46B5
MTKTKFSHRVIAVFLTLSFLQSLTPYNMLWASNNGPNSPEAAGFEPIDATDMVQLSTGDLSYVLPIMEVPGPEGNFPISLSYHAGITSDMDASWVGLGWYLNPGAINRTANGTPDDWNGGRSINFISFSDSETFYSVSVDVGFENSLSVGVGLNWGGNKGLSGSINAQYNFFNAVSGSASLSTTGNATIGVGSAMSISGKDGPLALGGGLSYSTQSQWSVSGAPSYDLGEDSQGYTNSAFVGAGYSSNGFSIGGGVNSRNSSNVNAGGGTGLSMSSFTAGDFSVSQQSFGISIPLKYIIGLPISLGFGRSKVTYKLRKGYSHREWGALYSSKYFDATKNLFNPVGTRNTEFSDYQDRLYAMDTYEQTLPQPEEVFIDDYETNNEKVNFTFMAYDDFSVAAQGLSGSIKPRILQNITLFGKGDNSQSPTDTRKLHTFYHHGSSQAYNNIALKSIGNAVNKLHFYFDGQFSRQEKVAPSTILNNNSANLINDFLSGGGHNNATTNPNGRARTPSFIEVFTNSQIQDGTARSMGLITPSNINDTDRGDTARFDPDGIGGYKITAPDGKTYHFTIPVYHYEQVQRTLLEENENTFTRNARHVNEKRQYSRYATHWLLNAITGPDYVDNGDFKVNEADFGYWVELEYGLWSEGFTWRNPYEPGVQNYNTNIENEIEKNDKGYYTFGRKQLYYLDKIKTRTHSAIFVKDIRYDAVGQDLKYAFDNANNGGGNMLTPTGANSGFNGTTAIYVKEPGVQYAREYSLKLDRILLLRNEIAAQISKKNIGGPASRNPQVTSLGSGLTGYTANTSHSPGWLSDDFDQAYVLNYMYQIHQEDRVYDITDINDAFIQSHIIKAVELGHSYDLARNSPSSPQALAHLNPSRGKLTLDYVRFLGENQTRYMPPIRYDYYMKDLNNISLADLGSGLTDTQFRKQYNALRRDQVDDWGFMAGTHQGRDKAMAWSLKEIKMPTGASIHIDYEKDRYWTEAFARRFWESDLEFSLQSYTNGRAVIKVKEDRNSTVTDFKFTDYFGAVGDTCYFDFFVSRCFRNFLGNNDERGAIYPANAQAEIVDLGSNYITLRLAQNTENFINTLFFATESDPISFTNSPRTDYVDKTSREKTIKCRENNTRTWRLVYRLLANKVPDDQTGGGLRVSRLTTATDTDTYITDYDYAFPPGNARAGISSGITSYAPVNGLKFVPYQSELPAPGVMYEYVTVAQKDASGNSVGSTRYRHNVLKPVFDIFEPNLEMPPLDENNPLQDDNIFWARVQNEKDGNNTRKVQAKKISLHVNTASIGQLRYMEERNAEGQVLSSSGNSYINGTFLNDEGKGHISESFNAMKTVFRTNDNGTIIYNDETKRLLSVSERIEYNNMLKSVKTYTQAGVMETTYEKIDPYLGAFTESRSTLADGTVVKEERFPAFQVPEYAAMGPKALDRNNKNMLTQEAMTVSSVLVGSIWRNTSAQVTTWKDTWKYDGSNTPVNDGIWRVHENHVWKGAVDSEGTLGTVLNLSSFNWAPGGVQTHPEWEKVSEIDRYSRWSSPLEAIDINGNYTATKMEANNTRVLASGNARYSELYYSGAETGLSGNTLDGGLTTQALLTGAETHTGAYALQINAAGQKAFALSGTVGTTVTGPGASVFRPQMYKASVWVKKLAQGTGNVKLYVNTTPYQPAETVSAGDWEMHNFYVPLTNNTTADIYVTDDTHALRYFDDFRFHPVYASVTGYVYDAKTEALNFILDANNMATRYHYDDAGRLCRTYAEVADAPGLNGGFKTVQRYAYNYIDFSPESCQCCDPGEAITTLPRAVDDAATINYDETLSYDVTANDSFGSEGPAASPITLTALMAASTGTAAVNDAGTPNDPRDDRIDYTPGQFFSGTATIDYRICDAVGNCSDASLQVTVIRPNVPPITGTVISSLQSGVAPNRSISGFIQGFSGGSGDLTFTWSYDVEGDINYFALATTTNSFLFQYSDPSSLCGKRIRFRCVVRDNFSGQNYVFNESIFQTVECNVPFESN